MTTKTKAKPKAKRGRPPTLKAKPPATADPNKPKALLLIPGRPTCTVKGCKLVAKAHKNYNMRGPSHYFQKHCGFHAKEKIAKKKGLENDAYSASIHRTRKFLKNYCENRDGRLKVIDKATGKIHKCTNKIIDIYCELQADHIDGNHNKKATAKTIQTLCANCHRLKTKKNGDHVTPRYSSSKWSRANRS